ncbi:hypothetical protein GLE_0791 [Lysobacter enzymogenes]|uniref:Uncharacterized protein n=1 Tax=Lysobacter enzymogenes TaxID=69 RepID=A0A0S2DC89_LYSEN|nr:hypothetical protein GLE_0791 [Lysobacter enzymogenes]
MPARAARTGAPRRGGGSVNRIACRPLRRRAPRRSRRVCSADPRARARAARCRAPRRARFAGPARIRSRCARCRGIECGPSRRGGRSRSLDER